MMGEKEAKKKSCRILNNRIFLGAKNVGERAFLPHDERARENIRITICEESIENQYM